MAERTYKLAVIPGDGIGPEVIREAMRALDRLSDIAGFQCEAVTYPFGGDHWTETGEIFPDSAFAEVSTMDAILVGAIGDPRAPVGLLERGIIGRVRWELDLYLNLRPIRCYAENLCPLKDTAPEDIDMMVVRENTEGLYAGIGGFLKKDTPDEVAVTDLVTTRKGVERCIRYAFETAMQRDRHLIMVDKANAVLAHDLWTRTFEQVGEEFPEVTREHAYVDAAAMWMIKNPSWFDTVVTTNLFGDILTDLGSMLQGGMGLASSANVHPGRVSMFEPIHGSAPKHAGKNKAVPLASHLAVSQMLDFLGEGEAAAMLEQAVARPLQSGRIPGVGSDSGVGTTEMGDIVLEELDAVAEGRQGAAREI